MIALSAGHNRKQKGACWEGHCEHEEAQRWVDLIYAEVFAEVPVILVPGGTLKDKVSFINGLSNCDVAVEIHFNAAGGRGDGSETLYCPGSVRGRRIAGVVQTAVASVMTPDRGVKEGWYRMDRPGVKDYEGDVEGDEKPDYFLVQTRCPAVILEPEFIHNQTVINQFRDLTCEKIARALIGVYKGVVNGTF